MRMHYLTGIFDLHQLAGLTSAPIVGTVRSSSPSTLECKVTHLSNEEIAHLEAQLRLQRVAVLGAIRQRLHQSDNPDELALANHFTDVREAAEADLLVDTDIGQLQLELADLGDIDAALARTSAGNYGICTGCSAPIPARRLRVQPTAQMCLPCQERFEQHRQPHPAPGR
jgi:DnaK suppressor protein